MPNLNGEKAGVCGIIQIHFPAFCLKFEAFVDCNPQI